MEKVKLYKPGAVQAVIGIFPKRSLISSADVFLVRYVVQLIVNWL